jgi:hypothetical protein
MLDKLQTYQQILFDLTANYLEPMSSAFQRLAYLHSLQEESTGKYGHEELAAVYGGDAVDQVVAHCHEEVFERILEMPLNAQGEDLGECLRSLAERREEDAVLCRERCRKWVPASSPSYLRELYFSNLDVLLELLLGDRPKPLPSN